ncbi:MAG TPA: IS3 family transposase [Syntrophorhabdaceae bacterium]|nr:IS3 family transposase [Syntrophorhabdaceae bacterium]
MLKEAGYTIKDACGTLGISRSSYYLSKDARVIEWPEGDFKDTRDEELVRRIKEIKAEHPFWGYRRVTAWLNHREGLNVNHKRVYRLMKENGLLAIQTVHKAKRSLKRSKPKADRLSSFLLIRQNLIFL